jgi:hypothetical protein
MATRKQRRRREKGRRHEYEYVYVDDEGQEVEVDEPEPEAKPKADKPATSGQKPTGGAKSKSKSKASTAGERVVEPPTWSRVGRRAAIFAPFILIFFYITKGKGDSTAVVLLRTLPLIVVLVPFMYLVDSFAYRSYQKRLAKRADRSSKKTK